MDKIKKITKMRLFLPIFSMILVMLINVVYDIACGNPAFSFFEIGHYVQFSGLFSQAYHLFQILVL